MKKERKQEISSNPTQGRPLRLHEKRDRRERRFNKMKTIGFVLKELNCDNVYLFVVRGGIPTIIYLIFDPGEEIRKIFEIKDIKSKEYLEDLLNRHHFEKIKL